MPVVVDSGQSTSVWYDGWYACFKARMLSTCGNYKTNGILLLSGQVYRPADQQENVTTCVQCAGLVTSLRCSEKRGGIKVSSADGHDLC